MEEPWLEAYEALAAGDRRKARAILEAHRAEMDPEDAADLEALLDGGPVKDLEARDPDAEVFGEKRESP